MINLDSREAEFIDGNRLKMGSLSGDCDHRKVGRVPTVIYIRIVALGIVFLFLLFLFFLRYTPPHRDGSFLQQNVVYLLLLYILIRSGLRLVGRGGAA